MFFYLTCLNLDPYYPLIPQSLPKLNSSRSFLPHNHMLCLPLQVFQLLVFQVCIPPYESWTPKLLTIYPLIPYLLLLYFIHFLCLSWLSMTLLYPLLVLVLLLHLICLFLMFIIFPIIHWILFLLVNYVTLVTQFFYLLLLVLCRILNPIS